MATVACPGCGLPRVEAEVGVKPCPVCDAAPITTNAPRVKPPSEPDPTEGLPADVSELNSPMARTSARATARPPEGGSRVWVVAAVTFALGALCGVGGVLGVQSIDWSNPTPETLEVVAKPEDDSPSLPPHNRLAIAPMPHEGGVTPIDFVEPDGADFQLPIQLPPPGVVETHQINKELHSIPNMKKGEHIILKGKVNTLRIHGLNLGAVLDASGLEAAVIIVSGTISSRSTLKLYAPNGSVQFSHKVDSKSRVEINAPGGDVRFMVSTIEGGREGAKIDNGSTVNITARAVEFKGDIAGIDTKVSVTLTTAKAWMRFASINDSATVEYKSQVAAPPPDITVGPVARTATFRKVE